VTGGATKLSNDRIAVDTNVLVRYLTWDDEAQSREAAGIIEGAQTVFVSTVVLCELVWVLKRAYRYDGKIIQQIIRRLTETRTIELDRPATEAGLAAMRKGGDFADGVIQFDADKANFARLVTFDRKFAKAASAATVTLLGSA
jgi:predicted nucleic-acid-binding protein